MTREPMTFSFERTRDSETVKRIITHKNVWPHVSDDHAPSKEAYQPDLSEKFHHILCRKHGQLMGLFSFLVQPESWEVHTCLLPVCWGESSNAARELLTWIWETTDCPRVTSMVPDYNKLAYQLACNAGLTLFRKDIGTYDKGGDKHDVFYFEILRPEKSTECPS